MANYSHTELEQKWRARWQTEMEKGTSPWLFDEKRGLQGDKRYLLDMFPYPSGSGLHVGHVEEKAALDIYARYLRARGENVLMPTAYDSFGLPTENYALKQNLTPQVATKQNTSTFHEQTEQLGISYDWSREFATSDPEYYKFTQWWFNFLYERGLAYRKKQPVNWCPTDQTVLANEQVIDGHCERCDSVVVQLDMEQWFFRISDYSERLLNDLEGLDWPESTKAGQRNWLGKSVGANLSYFVTKYPQIVFASTNEAKLARVRKLVKYLGLATEVLSPDDLGLEKLHVEEGSDIRANALAKAEAYAKLTKLPVLANDGGLFIDGEQLDPAQAKRNALEAAGVREEDLEQAEIATYTQNFYRGLARKHGGALSAEFVDCWGLSIQGESSQALMSRRGMTLTDKVVGETDIFFPVRSIYKVNATGKYTAEQTEAEEMVELKPQWQKLQELLAVEIEVFTTRADTQYGASFVVLAPDSKQLQELLPLIGEPKAVNDYIAAVKKTTELERLSNTKEKTGVATGLQAFNRLTGQYLPIYVSDYVLATVGTGAVVGVPAHDERDYAFAAKFKLPTPRVITGTIDSAADPVADISTLEAVYTGEGKLLHSAEFDGMDSQSAREAIITKAEALGVGSKKVSFKLRDWSISRQRYWGSPIPILYRKLAQEELPRHEQYQELPKAALHFHAFGSSATSVYHPAVDKSLTEAGVLSLTPNLPESNNPEFQAWQAAAEASLAKIAEQVRIDGSELGDNYVVTGRSLGCTTALAFAQTHKLRKLVLVAPGTQLAIDELIRPNNVFAEGDIALLEKFFAAEELDYGKIAENCGEIVLFLSVTDPAIPADATEAFFRAKFPLLRVVRFRDAGHFGSKDGVVDLPELTREVLAPVRLDVLRLLPQHLPVVLPEDVDYRPQGTPPLGTSKQFPATIPQDFYGPLAHGQELSPELDTMDTFVCSSWYFFRFLDPHNTEEFASAEKLRKFGPVDFYIGGAEHTVLHLLYSRFFTKVAYDAGLIDYEEPFLKLRHQGLISGPDGRKMSKRWGNVINPSDVVSEYGADTVRIYEMFMGPLEQSKAWSDGGVRGVRRFLQKIWDLQEHLLNNWESPDAKTLKWINKLIAGVGSDIENLKFNTAVSDMMKFCNAVQAGELKVNAEVWQAFLQVLQPFAPFLAAELAEKMGFAGDLSQARWPEAFTISADSIEVEEIVFTVMINGKVRENLTLPENSSEDTVMTAAFASEKVTRYIANREAVKRHVFVPNKLLSLVI